MDDKGTKETEEPLGEVARRIEEHAANSDRQILAAAILVREARQRVEAGEAGSVSWADWAAANINLAKSRLHELQRIAEAEDPAAAVKELRRETRERVKRHREKRVKATRALEEERKQLISWAKTAPIEQVRQVLGLIEEEGAGGEQSPNAQQQEQRLDAA